MKTMLAVVVAMVATAALAADGKQCGDQMVARAKVVVPSIKSDGEEMIRAICMDLKDADRATFISCGQKAADGKAYDACMKVAGRKAMGR